MTMQSDGDFYEDDESTEELLAAYDAGQSTTLTLPGVPVIIADTSLGLTGFPTVERVPTYGAGGA
jgi:glycosidase